MLARREVVSEYPHLLVAVSRRVGIGKRARADEEIVAVRQELNTQEAWMWIVREQPDDVRLQLELVRVPEALLHEGDPRAVRRPRRALAEPRQARDVGRQVIFGRTGPQSRLGGQRRDEECEGEERSAHARL